MLKNTKNFNLPEIEEKVLAFWKKNNIFEKSLKARAGKKPFRFYEGPPTANGRPGIHHAIGRAFKDVIPRYKTMRGYFVERKGGWDTHGLPVEIQVEKELGLKSKKEIEEYGIAAFNKRCKESVWLYKDEWERFTERIGFWLDLKNPYITYENPYIETLWWIFKKIAKKKLLYKGHRVVPWCTRCGTALSSHETAQGYKEVTENSVYFKLKLIKGQKIGSFRADQSTYILSWTTTPWTLPGNVALAVGKDFDYVGVRLNGETLIVVRERREAIFGKDGDSAFEAKGKQLVGLKYEPLFAVKPLRKPAAHKIYPADFVTTTDGTGIVHTAVMYGEDDYRLGVKFGLPEHHTVDERGKFTREVGGFSAMYVKDKATEEKIIGALNKKGFLFKSEQYTHDYPFCWRCQTPLLYYARDSWFIAMSKIKNTLIKENEKIQWIPAHIKAGRFGEWLKDLKDWSISRERYWGTPLPIWECRSCGKTEAVGSFEEASALACSRNEFILVRHGEADHNLKGTIAHVPESKSKISHLTDRGELEARAVADKLSRKKIDLIVSSPFARTKETAEIIAQATKAKVLFDARLGEISGGVFGGKPIKNYSAFFGAFMERFIKAPEGGENLLEVRRRMVAAVKDITARHPGKRIVIVSHGDPLWILNSALKGLKDGDYESAWYPNVGDYEEIIFPNWPFNEDGEIDWHRPYVDGIFLRCKKCGKKMQRVKEVADVWFDSGSMPFAQWHYPFENKELIDKGIHFPADYVAEAIDQTRGWFYTLLAVSSLLGFGLPYRAALSYSHVLDKHGKKMSKSKGNVVDPWQMIQKYGADVVRWYFFTVNEPGDSKNFDEADLGKAYRKFHALFYNSYAFLELYRRGNANPDAAPPKSVNILDRWILNRLFLLAQEATKALDRYDIVRAARLIEEFVGDLSHWYIRRSRRRFSDPRSKKDFESASGTLVYVLGELCKIAAPFSPFISEAIYVSLFGEKLSVHLMDWPEHKGKIDNALIAEINEVRNISSQALALRAEAGIKVRQPLKEIRIKNLESRMKGNDELIEMLKEEVNIKEIVFDSRIEKEIELDTEITPELYKEGVVREFVRMIQKLRQDAGYAVHDKVRLNIEAPKEMEDIIREYGRDFKRSVKAVSVEYGRSTGKMTARIETKLNEIPVVIGLKRIKSQ